MPTLKVAISVKGQRWLRPSKDLVYFYLLYSTSMGAFYILGGIIIPAKGSKTGVFVKCEICGKEIYKTKSQYNKAKHHFCSNKCSGAYNHSISVEDRKCEICGKIFSVSKSSSQRFCSMECQGKWQSKQIGDLNPRTNRVECTCDNCGTNISIIPANYKRFKYHFCSNQCRVNWYATDFSQNESWKEDARIRSAKLLSERKVDTNTKPQIIVNSILDKMGVDYENEYNCKYYAMDNYLTTYNLCIEVMGDYWHCNPQKYSKDKISDIQRKRIFRDKAKHTYIAKIYNIEILYLWECDILHSPFLCEKLIAEYIKNKGDLEDYNSFNYHIDYDEIILNDNIVIPYYMV